jgi:hypothetical protein
MKERGGIGPGSMKQENIAASRIEPIVERVVGQAIESHVAGLRAEIVRRVMEEIAVEAGIFVSAPQDQSSKAADLALAVVEIQSGSSQREILRALLDASAPYAPRVALFVVKGSHATGWQSRGFADSNAVKDFALDETSPAVVCAIRDRAKASVAVSDMDQRFLEKTGSPISGESHIFPLILKDKVAALVYADAGVDAESSVLEIGALQVLVLSTSAWLEVNSLRKSAHKEASAAQAGGQHLDGFDGHEMPGVKTSSTPPPAFNDPFASHAPAFAAPQSMAAAAGAVGEAPSPAVNVSAVLDAPTISAEPVNADIEVQAATAVVEPEPAEIVVAEPVVKAEVSVVAEVAPVSASAPVSAATMSPEDQYIHGKAQRFARLLVDEIKLYNQAKVAEGRENKDLYDRLKEPIDKSRATYQKRYGTTVAASANYFQREIIRSLAEDDISIMGANFRQ